MFVWCIFEHFLLLFWCIFDLSSGISVNFRFQIVRVGNSYSLNIKGKANKSKASMHFKRFKAYILTRVRKVSINPPSHKKKIKCKKNIRKRKKSFWFEDTIQDKSIDGQLRTIKLYQTIRINI